MKKINYFVLSCFLGIFFMVLICFISSKDEGKNPAEKSSVVLSRVDSAPVPQQVIFCGEAIDLTRYDMRERFDREINAFTYLHSTTLLQIKRANRYFPVIEPVLAKNNIPDDFKYLAVIESMLDVRAYSPAQAAGLWQFITQTGKQYGLEITSQVDERYHVEKSTEAACRYLKDAYRKFNSWTDVAASYNAGMNRIEKGLREQNVDTAFDLLLVEETSRYVFRILAMKEIFSNPYRYGFILKSEDLYPVIPTKAVKITEDVTDFADFAQKQGINYYQLKNFNVWLRDKELKTMGKTYVVQIPLEEGMCYDPKKTVAHDGRWVVD